MQTLEIQSFQIIGVAIRTTNENGQAAEDIGNLWQKFLGEKMLESIPNKVDNTVYSLYTDYESDYTEPYTAIIGCKVSNLDEIPSEMTGRSFEGGKYCKTSARGNLMEGLVVNHWSEIWGMNLNRRYSVDFEIFDERASNPTNAEVDFMVAINS